MLVRRSHGKWHFGLREGFHFEGGIAARSSKHHRKYHHQHPTPTLTDIHILSLPKMRHGKVRRPALLQDPIPLYLPYHSTPREGNARRKIKVSFVLLSHEISHLERRMYVYILSFIKMWEDPPAMYFIPYSYFLLSTQRTWLSMWLPRPPSIEG